MLLPSLVNRGVEANDRAKYLLALVQAARDHGDDPVGSFSSLCDERLAAGMSDDSFDEVVGRSWRAEQSGADGGEQDAVYVIPGVRGLHEALAAAVAEMLAPLTADVAEDQEEIALDPEPGPRRSGSISITVRNFASR